MVGEDFQENNENNENTEQTMNTISQIDEQIQNMYSNLESLNVKANPDIERQNQILQKNSRITAFEIKFIYIYE